jgi:hypothetical protein
MNPDNRRDKNNNSSRNKVITAIPIAGIMVAAASLLSGLSLINSNYQPALAQQDMTGNATTTGGGGGAQSACAPTQTGGGQNATSTMRGGGGAATMGTNVTSTTTAGQDTTQLASEVRLHIEETCMALQNDDIQGALVHLDLALNMLGSNMTTSAGGGAATNATMGGSGEGTTTTADGSTAGEGEGSGGGAVYGG